MQLNQRFGNSQPQARAVLRLGELAFDLFKRTPEFLQRVGGDADAGILDADQYGAARDASSHRDAAVLRGELDGIGEQIERDLLERAPVGSQLDAGCDAGGDGELL